MATKQNGFTLVELMVTMAVLATILTIAIPNYQNMVQGDRMAAQANEVLTALNYARSEAVKRGVTTTMCSSSGGSSCAVSTNWSTGWLVFVDTDGDGIVDAGESILRVWPALSSGNTLNAGTNVRVTFSATGFATGYNDTYRLCDTRPKSEARSIVINAMGRSYVAKGASVCP